MVPLIKRVWFSLSQPGDESPGTGGSHIQDSSPFDQRGETTLESLTNAAKKVSAWQSWLTALTSPRFLKTLAFLGSVLLIGLSLWIQAQEWAARMRPVPWIVLVIGLVLLILSSQIIEKGSAPGWLNSVETRLKTWLGIARWQLLCLVLSLVLAWLTILAAGDELMMINPWLAIPAWILGIALAVLAGWRFREENFTLSRQTAILAGLLIAAALLVRVINLAEIPVVLTGDEASAGLSAVDVTHGLTNNIFRAGWFSFPALHSFLQAVPIAFLGQTTFALRLTSVIAGTLTVMAVYLAGRVMFGERPALFAAIFLAAFNFHNHFSRIGLNNIWDGLWFVTVLGLLWHAWERQSRRSFLLAGLALGLSQYFYVSVRALFLIIPIWVLISAWFDRVRLRRSLPDLAHMGLVALVTVLPLAWFYARYPHEFLAPLRRVSILGDWMMNEVHLTGQSPWRILFHQIALSMEGFAHTPLRAWYQPGTPLLRLAPAILFFLAIGLLLRKPRDSRTLLLGLWVLVLGLMNGFSEGAPAAQRYVAASPAVAMLVGYGLSESGSLLESLWPQYKRVFGFLAFAIIMLVGVDEVRFYFQVYTPRSDLGGENTLVANRLADFLKDKSSQWEVALFGSPRMGYYSIAALPYLAPQIMGFDMNKPWGSDQNPRLSGDHIIFVFLPGLERDLRAVQASYPGGQLREERTSDGRLLYWLYQYASGDGSTPSGSQAADQSLPYPAPIPTPIQDSGGYP
jgi:4-amino-4-deoxy-L-arabinose transferase-like glycosyltransferase